MFVQQQIGVAKPFRVSRPPGLTGYRVIDDHCHVNYHGHSVDDAVANMDALGIERAWLLAWDAPAAEFGALDPRYLSPTAVGLPFDDVVRAMERFPGRFVPGWAVDPRRPNAADRLRNAVATYGVRVFGELKVRLMYDNLDLIELYRLCGDLGLPVLFHLEIELPNTRGASVGGGSRPYWYGGEFDVLERFLAKCPETTFIGHAPGFWREISGDAARAEMYPDGPVVPGGRLPSLLERFPNLHCDMAASSGLNALSRDPEHARAFIERFADRILFGRDYWDDAHLHFLASLDLPQEVLAKVLAGNALRLVPLD
jgi:predicted TIM-barrel fold metal-dependent hydrolase